MKLVLSMTGGFYNYADHFLLHAAVFPAARSGRGAAAHEQAQDRQRADVAVYSGDARHAADAANLRHLFRHSDTDGREPRPHERHHPRLFHQLRRLFRRNLPRWDSVHPRRAARGRSGAGHDARTDVFFTSSCRRWQKRVLLPVSNEVITLVKDTSLANVIAVAELFRAAKNEASRHRFCRAALCRGAFLSADERRGLARV